jgi:hypothetical protein
MLDYNWEVLKLQKVDIEESKDVVLQVDWKITGTSEDAFSTYFEGATPLKYNLDSPNFITFNELTEDEVIQWVKDILIKEDAYEMLLDELEEEIERLKIEQNKVEVEDKELPWNKNKKK